MSKNYYDILGVQKSASQDEIKKAFRKLAHEHHPDKAGGNEAKFKEINEAYQALGNEEKRKQYDQFGQTFNNAQGFGAGQGFNWQDFMRQSGNGSQGFNFSFNDEDFSAGNESAFGGDPGDLFGDFFGGGSKNRSRKARRDRGQDLEYQMEISLKESAFGAEEIIRIEKQEVCDNCGGKGYDSFVKINACARCGGRGRITEQRRTIFGVFQNERICSECEGEGKRPEKYCASCGGAGRVTDEKQLKIKIPAGINNGQSIKLTGEGEAGEKGAGAGDLYITFSIKPEHGFKREGNDIIAKKNINITQAALGDKVEIETLDGWVNLKVPAGTESGKIFRWVGKGTQKLHGRGRGDQLVEIIVKTPAGLSRRAKELLEELGEEIDGR